MGYATLSDVTQAAGGEEKLVEISDWGNRGVVDTDVIDRAIVAADAFINAYLAQRYAVPVDNPSDLLRTLSAAEAVYTMRLQRRMLTPDDTAGRTDRERILKSLSEGRLRPSDPVPDKSSAGGAGFVPFDSAMARKNSRGMW